MEYVSTFKNRFIYIYRINDVQHLDCLKIGEATSPDGLFEPNCKELNDAARKRIKEQTQTAGVKFELLHTESTIYLKNGQIRSFTDGEVHDILERSGIKPKDFGKGNNAREWYCCDLETAKNAIAAAKNGQSCLNQNQKTTKKSPVRFRPEQLLAIEQTKKVLKRGNKMLWNAKMRMGKTLTSLEVVKQMKFKRTIIITHRPVVIDGWSKDFEKIFFETDTDWRFGSREIGAKTIAELEKSGKNYIYFASIQDLRGSKIVSGKFDKNEDVFKTNWDLVIIDEAHEGTQTEKGQSVQDMLVKENTKVINLSGTPFNLLETNEFDETNTFTWDYVMEQRAKQEWALTHPGDYNPYEELPKLNLLTFNLGALVAEYQDEDKAFNFTEFFRTNDSGEFVHKEDVRRFLDIISSEKGETLYPFSSAQYREFFHHTFWIVPGVKEGKALKEMLDHHPVFGAYNVVNVCGKEDEETTGDPLEDVRIAIGESPENTYTITLSCRRLTTGVTVREWTAVLYLAGSKNTSPAAYMQTIFRVQSPGRIGGRMKTDCYVFDFAPDRTLKMVVEAAKVSAKAGETTEDDRQILGDFLNFCPIISCEGTEMKPYNVEQMMRQLKRIYVDKVVNTGFEDGHLYSRKLLNLSDIELERFADLREIIGQTKASNKIPEIPINRQGFDKEDVEKMQKEQKKKTGKQITIEEARLLLELQMKRKQRDTAVSILRGISIRMPLLLYGAKLESEEEQITLDRFVELVDDQSWAEFMPPGVTKDLFANYKKYYDEDIFSAAGHQIRQLALAADRLPVLQRIQRITDIFSAFRNPDKETVLTPWRVVNMHLSDTVGGYCFYDEEFENPIPEPHRIDRGLVSQRLFENAGVRILEINSKSGLYPLYMAYSVFRHRLQTTLAAKRNLFRTISADEERQIWNDVLAENIFVICKTEMARLITQRTLAGFTSAKVNTHVYDDLLNQITNKQSEFIKRLLSGSIFPKIKNNMKFDAIVGNPPYQEVTAKKETDNGQKRSKSIFQYFQIVSDSLGKYVSLIYPGGRWIHRSGKGMAEFGLKQINDPHLEKLIFYSDANDLFSVVGIADGISIVMKNMSKETQQFKYEFIQDGVHQTIELPSPGENLIPLNPSDLLIVDKIVKKVSEHRFNYLDKSVLSQKLFSIESDFVEQNPTLVKEYVEGAKFDKETEIKLLTNDNAGKAGRAKWYIAKRDVISTGKEYLDKWKVVVSSANAGGQKRSNQIQVLDNYSAFGRSRVALKTFDTEKEAQNFLAYAKSKFIRFAFLMTDESLTSLAKLVPDIGNYKDNNGIIDFKKDVDKQLFELFEITEQQQNHIQNVLSMKKE